MNESQRHSPLPDHPTPGTVYLIGAGPGDPGLLTLKGQTLLSTCDAIVYDYLAAEALLKTAKPDSELLYVGKQGGDHTLPQAAINDVLVNLGRAGKSVARLKGGDPYIFGRGGEEAEVLHEAGIPFEVVPGVTSATAATAYAGIPLTHRAFASSVTLVTGHEDPAKHETAHNWAALAGSTGTLVFYMGMKNLAVIVRKLIDNGMDAATPAALIQWGTTSGHRSATGSLSALPEIAESQGFSAPALIVVGQVVALRDKLAWFEGKSLLGCGVMVTRSRGQASAMARQLGDLGAEVVEFPTIRIAPPENPALVREAVCCLRDYDWVVFTSPNGVDWLWRELDSLGLDARAFAASKVAAIGPGTADALQAKGLRADLIPKQFVAEGLLSAIVDQGVSGSRVLLAQAAQARDVLAEGLKSAGARCDAVPVYQTLPDAKAALKAAEALTSGRIHYVTFASSSSVDHFLAALPPEVLEQAGPRFACIGPITARTLEAAGHTCHVMPERHTITDLVAAVAADRVRGKEVRPC